MSKEVHLAQAEDAVTRMLESSRLEDCSYFRETDDVENVSLTIGFGSEKCEMMWIEEYLDILMRSFKVMNIYIQSVVQLITSGSN